MTNHFEELAHQIARDLYRAAFSIEQLSQTSLVIERSLRQNLFKPVRAALTDEQMRCLVFIKEYTDAMNASPTYEKIMQHLGLKSKSGIHRLVTELESRAAITRIPCCAQSITLTKLGAITVETACL